MTDEIGRANGAEERLQFLLDLGDRLRSAESPAEVACAAAEMLSQALDADRTGYASVDPDAEMISVIAAWPHEDLQALADRQPLRHVFNPVALAELKSGRSLVASDAEASPFFGGRAIVVAPLLAAGRLVALIFAISEKPRQWQGLDIDLVADVGSRTLSAFNQAKVETALRESEERLLDITDALPVLIAYLDAGERFRFANKRYEWWFNRPRHKIIGRRLSDLMPRAAYEARKPFVDRALAGEPVRFEVGMPLPEGMVETDVQLLPHHDGHGRTTGIYALVQDITERKKAGERLRQSELRFRQFAEQNPAMIWSCDAAGQLIYLSSRWYEYTGQNPEAALTENWDEFTHPDDRKRLHEQWRKALLEGDIYDIEIRLLRYDGVYRWHSVRAEPLLSNDGTIEGWLGTNSDIDDAVAEREERKRDHDRLWRISQELMVVRDMEGAIISANPSATRILGWRHDELIGRSIYDLIHPDDIADTIRRVSAQLSGEGVLSVQNRYRCKDGSFRTIDWRGVLHEGHVHSVGRDITAELQAAEELKRAEEALRQSQKMESVGRLTGGIAHDFNNMLAGIIGSLNLLQRRIASGRLEDTTRFIEAAQTSAQRAAALTQRLLAFGRRQPLDVKPVDVNALIVSLDDLLRRTIGPSIALRLELDADLWLAEADDNQLESAILNLAINARDAMPGGGVLTLGARNATVSSIAAALSGNHVEVYVADTGEGMAPEVLQQAFEPFFTTKPLGQGTGLGLSMVYGFVKQIGGDAKIESNVGEGTVVRLFLPRSSRSAFAPLKESMLPAPSAIGETVLVVEDDDAVRMLVMEVLAELGCEGVEVSDAPSALPIIGSDRAIDLLISDIGLPGMSGLDLAKLARAQRPDLRILFITGYAEATANRRSYLTPDMHLLVKPFSLEQLAAKISDILKSPAGI